MSGKWVRDFRMRRDFSSTGENLTAGGSCVHSLIESQVRKSPNNAAVSFGADINHLPGAR